jgi:hypothetical protein
MPNLTIYPYLLDGACWVFDDEPHGLKEEAFVLGMTEMISRVVVVKGLFENRRGLSPFVESAASLEAAQKGTVPFSAAGSRTVPDGCSDAARGIALTFGVEPFDHDVQLAWISPEEAAEARHYPVDWLPQVGNWYRGMIFGEEMIGWLCPALFLYFPAAPPTIYAKAEPLPAGLDPIWHVAADDPRARRFVSAPGVSRRGTRV